VAAGRVDLVAALAAAADLSTPRGQTVATAVQAILTEARGDLAEAVELHAEAAAGWAVYGFAFESARANLARAGCLDALGLDPGDAAATAAEVFQGLGAASLAARALALAGGA